MTELQLALLVAGSAWALLTLVGAYLVGRLLGWR